MTVGMRRKTAVVASACVDVDSGGVRCTGSLRCDLWGNFRCRLRRLRCWIRVIFSHDMVSGGVAYEPTFLVRESRAAASTRVFALVTCTANRSTFSARLLSRVLAADHDQPTSESQDRNDDA